MSMIFGDDDIDFSAYMDMTDHDHKVKSARDYADEVVDFFHAEKPVLGARLIFQKTAHLLRFRPHEVTIWSGYNGHGKSLLLGQSIIGFAMQGQSSCLASMEMRPVTTLSRMARQASASSKPDQEFLREFCDVLGDGLWLYDQQGMVDANKVVAVIRYAADKKKCEHFVIDSLLKCGIGEDDYNRQKHFIDQLCSVAKETGCHIHLVAHAKKGQSEMSPPGKYDIKGSGSISDQVDNVITVYRNKSKEADHEKGIINDDDPDALAIVSKQRNGEWEGTIKLWYDRASLQFLERHGNPMNMLDPRCYQ